MRAPLYSRSRVASARVQVVYAGNKMCSHDGFRWLSVKLPRLKSTTQKGKNAAHLVAAAVHPVIRDSIKTSRA